jgi:hypothetical protein
MEPSTSSPHPSRAWLLALLAALAAATLAAHGPIAQWPGYHQFCDTRPWGGLPNAANLLSNLAFAATGAWGLRRLAGRPGMAAWRLFAAALLTTAVGSAFYHWAPADGPLVGDRLPIAWACAALTCAFLAERVDSRWGLRRVLGAAVVAASLSVAAWWIGAAHGHGDLRPYVFVQFLPMLLIPAALALGLAPRTPQAVRGSAWCTALALYALAKATEVADEAVMQVLGVISGHTLKHLLAAAAAAWLLHAATPQTGRPPQNR